jgi:sulfur carrier protein
MNVLVNGESREVTDAHSINQLVDELGLMGKRFAVEVNNEIIPRSRYANYRLQPGDKVEIVHAIGGG